MKTIPQSDRGWLWDEAGEPTTPDLLAIAFGRCFAGEDGARALEHLRDGFLLRRLSPRASDQELRFLEGQRALVAHILALVARGGGKT